MSNYLRTIAIIESCIIVVLLFSTAFLYLDKKESKEKSKTGDRGGLLSTRIYTGLLEPKSLLILNYAPLRKSFKDFISENNVNVSIYVENLRSGAYMGIDERRGYSAASLSKVPLAMLIMKKIEEKKLSFDTLLEINETSRTKTWGNLYSSSENKLTVGILIKKMLSESDNTAFNVLFLYPDMEDMQLLLNYLDYYSEESDESSEEYLITPKSMYNVFSSLYFSTFLNAENSEYILSSLTNTTFDIKSLAELPSNATVAHKFAAKYNGTYRGFHDCGIIYYNEQRVFYCVMTKDMSYETAVQVVGAVVNKIFYYSLGTRQELDTYKRG